MAARDRSAKQEHDLDLAMRWKKSINEWSKMLVEDSSRDQARWREDLDHVETAIKNFRRFEKKLQS